MSMASRSVFCTLSLPVQYGPTHLPGAAYIKTNPARAYGKAQSRGGDANTVLEVVFRFSVVWNVSVVSAVCVHAGREIAFA